MPILRTLSSLLDYAMPRSDLFQPSKAYMKSEHRFFRLPTEAPMPGLSNSGGATPMPDRTSSFTPAWDPLSRTPRCPSSLTPAWNPPQEQPLATNSRIASKQPVRPPHPLLDEQLVGANLKVVVDDGGKSYNNREVVVSIAKVEGDISIRHHVYGTSKGLVPAWVSSRSPNPTRDNGLLVVVEGEHCGKFVRRIHHRYYEENGNKQALIMLAVVKKVDGAPDILTGERLELGPDSLCLASETSEGKNLNANLMISLRENARKRR